MFSVCVFILLFSALLNSTNDDELNISYHGMNASDKAYYNNETGIIDVPSGGVSAEDGVYAVVGEYSLRRGNYHFLITYACPEESLLTFKNGSEVTGSVILPKNQSEFETSLYLDRPTEILSWSFHMPEKSPSS
ncbi:MAG: hypothetical protein K6F86_10615 [Lachnospiraceae bacterium]|nr:hypothetical protein [Lachnospiraceae bacterium]